MAASKPTAGKLPPLYLNAVAPVPLTSNLKSATAAVFVTVNNTYITAPVVLVKPVQATSLIAVAAAVEHVP